MATFKVGPQPDADTLDALLDGVQPQEQVQRSFASVKFLMAPGGGFPRSELAKLNQAESLVDAAGDRFRPLDSWLVPVTRFADSGDDDEGISVRVRTAGLVVEIPRRAFDEPPQVLPLEVGPPPLRQKVTAVLQIRGEDGPAAEHGMLTELDAEAGRLRLELPFGEPALRMQVLEAINGGRASIALAGTHMIRISDGPGAGPTPPIVPLPVRPIIPIMGLPLIPMVPLKPAPKPKPSPVAGPVARLTPLVALRGVRKLHQLSPIVFQRRKLNRSEVKLAKSGSESLALQVSGASSCTVTVSWAGSGAAIEATLVAPNGTLRARAVGSSMLSLEYEIRAGEASAGTGSWAVRLINRGNREVTCTVLHNLPRKRPLVKRQPKTPRPRRPIPGRRPIPKPGIVVVRPQLVVAAPLVMERMPDAGSKMTVPAGGAVERVFGGQATRGLLEARATWEGKGRLTMEIRGPDDKLLASAKSGSGAWLRISKPGAVADHRLILRNHGKAPLALTVSHTPGQLQEVTTQPPLTQPDFHQHPISLTIALDLPRVSHGWVYPDAENDETWQPVALSSIGSNVHVRASADMIGQYFYLPEEFRLGFMPNSTMPAVLAELEREDGGEEDDADDYRIQATLVAVPWTSVERREALREHLQRTRDLPFCGLSLASGLPAKLELLDDDGGASEVTVFLDRGFVLPLDMPARQYNLLATKLQSAVGVAGAVKVALPDGGELPINVRLSLTAIAVHSVQPQIQQLSAGGGTASKSGFSVQLMNVCEEPVTVKGTRAWRVRLGDIGYHDAEQVVGARSPQVQLQPEVQADLALAPTTRPGLDQLHIEVGEATISSVDAAHWLERIHRDAVALPSSELVVRAVGLDSAELQAAGFAGLQVALILPSGSRGEAKFMEPAQSEWKTTVAHSLDAYASGTAGLDGVVAEVVASYPDSRRQLQRLPLTGPLLVVRPPGVETADSHYEITVLDAAGETVRSETRPAAEMAAALDGLRNEGLYWRLRVVEPADDPTPDDPTPDEPIPDEPIPDEPIPDEPIPDEPTDDPVDNPDSTTIEVVARLLDFDNVLSRAFVTLKPDDASAGSEVVQLTSASDVASWQPAQGTATPFRWEATFILQDGSSRSATGTAQDALLVLELPAG